MAPQNVPADTENRGSLNLIPIAMIICRTYQSARHLFIEIRRRFLQQAMQRGCQLVQRLLRSRIFHAELREVQIGCRYDRAIGNKQRVMDNVLKLANIPGPWVS
jgi:hypothetical protein